MPGPRTRMLPIACVLKLRMRPGRQTSRSNACAISLFHHRQGYIRCGHGHGGAASAPRKGAVFWVRAALVRMQEASSLHVQWYWPMQACKSGRCYHVDWQISKPSVYRLIGRCYHVDWQISKPSVYRLIVEAFTALSHRCA